MKKIITICISIFLLTAISVFGAPEIIDAVKIATMEVEPGSISVDTNQALYAIKKSIRKGENVQEDAESYAYLLAYLNPTKEEIAYIDTLISKGYSTKALSQIFEFWKDTTEDISIIEMVYEFKPIDLDVLYWVDSAFIELDKLGKTNNHYSDLSVEDVKAYYNNGIEYEDIMTADKLSRRGTKNIETILSRKGEKISWYEIIDEVYEISQEESQTENINKYKEIENPYEIIESVKLSKESGKAITEIFDDVLSGKSSIATRRSASESKHTKIRAELIEQGIWLEEKETDSIKGKGGAFK